MQASDNNYFWNRLTSICWWSFSLPLNLKGYNYIKEAVLHLYSKSFKNNCEGAHLQTSPTVLNFTKKRTLSWRFCTDLGHKCITSLLKNSSWWLLYEPFSAETFKVERTIDILPIRSKFIKQAGTFSHFQTFPIITKLHDCS